MLGHAFRGFLGRGVTLTSNFRFYILHCRSVDLSLCGRWKSEYQQGTQLVDLLTTLGHLIICYLSVCEFQRPCLSFPESLSRQPLKHRVIRTNFVFHDVSIGAPSHSQT